MHFRPIEYDPPTGSKIIDTDWVDEEMKNDLGEEIEKLTKLSLDNRNCLIDDNHHIIDNNILKHTNH